MEKQPLVRVVAAVMEKDGKVLIARRRKGDKLAETARHHTRRAGRVSLYVAAGTPGLPDPFDGTSLRQDERGGIAPWR